MNAPWIGLPLCAMLLAGCGHREGDGHEHASDGTQEELEVPSFSEKSGLFLPEVTRRSLNLKLAEITEQRIDSTIPLPLRVYQTSPDHALVTGVLSPEQTQWLQPGQKIQAQLPDGTTVTGAVRAIRSEMRHATGKDELLGVFPGIPQVFSVGDFVAASARLAPSASVTTVPRRALLENSEGRFVYTVSGAHFVRTAVETGATNDDFVEITSGLYAGDEVVLEPVLSLWLTELAAVKGGQACCLTPPKGK